MVSVSGRPELEVHDAAPSRVRHLVAIAARAFWDDPMFNFFQPDLLRQHERSAGFFHSVIGDCARHGVVEFASVGADPVGVAAWLGPGTPLPTGGRRALAQARLALPAVLRSQHRRTALKLMAEMPKRHLHEPHWYLAVLAADPLHQGRGVGTALLTPRLDAADAEGLPVYLETQKEANLAYYRRFGFDLTGTIDVDDAPPVYTMVRRPR